MWLNQDSLARSLIYATSTPEVPSTYIHSFPSPESPKNILLLIRERIAKNISVFPCKCSSYLVTTPCYIISRDECSKKRDEEIKRGKCPEPRKKRKSETRGKNEQVSDSRIRGTRYPLLIFGNAIRNWSASARISVSTSPGMLSRVSYLYFLPLGERVHLTNRSITTNHLGNKECFSMWVINREDCNRSLLLTLVRMIYCSIGEANGI